MEKGKRKVVVTEWIGEDGLDRLRKVANTTILNQGFIASGLKGSEPPTEDTILKSIVDADALIVRNAAVTRKIIESGKKLKIIVVFSGKTTHVNLEAARSRGVYVSQVKVESSEAVAEFTFMLILALTKNLLVAQYHLRRGEFDVRRRLLPPKIRGLTLGIIGMGKIGSRVAEFGQAFGMHVIAYSPHTPQSQVERVGSQLVGLTELLSNSDIVTLHTSLTDDKVHFIGERELKLMKKTSFIVNTARGQLVDETALVKALANGWIMYMINQHSL